MADATAGAAGAGAGSGPATNGATGGVQPSGNTGAQGAARNTGAAPGSNAGLNGGPARGADGKFLPGTGGGAGQTAAPIAEPVKPTPPQTIKGKINVYGKEEEIELTHEDALRNTQLKRAYEKKLQQHEEQSRKARRLLEIAERDPIDFLKQLGRDPEKMAEELLIRRQQMAAMTDEQRAIHDRDQQIAALQAEKNVERERQKTAAAQQREEMLIERYKQEFSQVAEQHGMEKTWDDLHRFAEAKEMLLKKTRGVPPTPAEIAALAKKSIDRDVDRSIAHLDGEQLLRRLGPKVLEKLTKAMLARHHQQHSTPQTQQPPAPYEPPKPKTYLSEAELNARIRELSAPGRK